MNSVDHVQTGDIPNIELYMDQVTHFMEENLSHTRRHEDDKILTKTMINNYAKNKLLPAPVKKRYSRVHQECLTGPSDADSLHVGVGIFAPPRAELAKFRTVNWRCTKF